MLIEAYVLSYLKTKLSVDVYTEIPSDHSETYVTIEKTDSGRTDYIDAATIEVHSYAPTKYEAAVLDSLVKTAMAGDGTTSDGIAEQPEISACKYGGGNDAPQTATKNYRYRSYYNLFY